MFPGNVGKPIRSKTLSELSEKKMGGGKKKLTLKQMDKIQTREAAKKESKTSTRPTADKKVAQIVLPNLKSEKVMTELKKARAITPYAISSRFDICISVARDLLKELERQGTIEYVSGSKNLKIYKLPD